MKKYIGTKMVNAEPMTKGEAFKKNLLKIGVNVTEEDSAQDGYAVEYEDGYTSWSPKEVFEKAYKLAETFQDRLQIEERELDDKITKLNHFIQSEKFIFLNENQRQLMNEQYRTMVKYQQILKKRIADGEDKN
jgi:hypothetical protein